MTVALFLEFQVMKIVFLAMQTVVRSIMNVTVEYSE